MVKTKQTGPPRDLDCLPPAFKHATCMHADSICTGDGELTLHRRSGRQLTRRKEPDGTLACCFAVAAKRLLDPINAPKTSDQTPCHGAWDCPTQRRAKATMAWPRADRCGILRRVDVCHRGGSLRGCPGCVLDGHVCSSIRNRQSDERPSFPAAVEPDFFTVSAGSTLVTSCYLSSTAFCIMAV